MELLDPSHEQRAVQGEPAPRLTTLQGKTLGVISNGKENTVPFFDLLATALQRDHGVAEVVRRVKINYSAPAEDELMAEAMGWDAVLSGVGD
ncbi:MAG: hypothetical protein P8N02_05290 [Actinomycetota bacterium]|jgi:hypothetical protein|nr:hypothetical protein [Actinomycetota bacterium]